MQLKDWIIIGIPALATIIGFIIHFNSIRL